MEIADFREGTPPSARSRDRQSARRFDPDGLLQTDDFENAGEAAIQFRRYQELGGPDPRVNDWLRRL